MKKIHMALFTVVLIFSVINSGTVYAQSQPFIDTGDTFRFEQDREHHSTWDNYFQLSNDSNTSQLYRYEGNGHVENTILEGEAEVVFVNQRDSLPDFTTEFCEAGDTGCSIDQLLLLDWWGQSVAGSNRSDYHEFYDLGGSSIWENHTNPETGVENTSGWYYGMEDDNNVQPVWHNATYAIIFEEMVTDSKELYNYYWFPGMESATFDWQVPLVKRTVYTDTQWPYSINGQTSDYDIRAVSSEFSLVFSEVFNTSINFGGVQNPPPVEGPILSQNEPPQDEWVDVEATLYIETYYSFEQIFDQATGLLLDFYEYRSMDLSYYLYNENYTKPPSPLSLNQVDEGPQSFEVDIGFELFEEEEGWNTLFDASSHFGRNRPQSVGTNQILENDILVYDFEQSSDFDMESTITVGQQDRTDNHWGFWDVEGDATFDVYHDRPDGFNSLIFVDATASGEKGWSTSDPNEPGFTDKFGPEEFRMLDYEYFQSTASQEIVAFFEDNMYFNFGDDGFFLPIPHDLPKNGAINNTKFHMDFDNSEGNEYVSINGFDHKYFNLDMHAQNYGFPQTQTVPFGFSIGDGPDAIWIEASAKVDMKGIIAYYYDEETGVLLAREERIDGRVEVITTQTVDMFDPNANQMVPVEVKVDMQIDLRERMFLLLNTHPHEYQTAQAADTFDHGEDTSSINNTTDEGVDVPGFDIPLSTTPVFTGLFVAVIILRKRKYR